MSALELCGPAHSFWRLQASGGLFVWSVAVQGLAFGMATALFNMTALGLGPPGTHTPTSEIASKLEFSLVLGRLG